MTTFIELPNNELASEISRNFCKLMSLSTPKEKVTEFYNTLTPLFTTNIAELVNVLVTNHSRIFAETEALGRFSRGYHPCAFMWGS
jgi:hypothetical protein